MKCSNICFINDAISKGYYLLQHLLALAIDFLYKTDIGGSRDPETIS